MKFQKFFDPLVGEWVIGVTPKPELRTRAGWQRRLNLYTGRNLSDVALQMEQTGRAGRLALRGQMLSAGVITGLEIGLETALEPVLDVNGDPVLDPETEQPQLRPVDYFRINTGQGMAASGEDVMVPRALRVEVGDVPVYTLASVLAEAGDSSEGEPTGGLNDRRLGPPLREFISMPTLPTTFPRAGILVFQPVVVDVVGNYDPTDPCEQDPANYAYEDWQQVDGCQLVLYTWPNEWRTLPEAAAGRWQNRIAYTIFEAELNLGSNGLLPWEQLGVPIALVGFDADWSPLFVDRYAVVRDGGRYARRATLMDGRGDPFLWQARVRQLVEQVTIMGDVPIADIAAQMRYLPPVGMLPTDAVDLESPQKINRFFPDTYTIDIAPVPLEQLDAVLEANASLQPFDTFTTDQVRVLAPVPQQFFEPALLVTETIAPEFQQAIAEFVIRRNDALRRRANVRRKYAALIKGISGKDPIFAPERDRVEAIELQTAPLVYSGRAHRSANLSGLHQHFFNDPARVLAVLAGATLYFYVYLDPDNPPTTLMVQFFVQNWEHRAHWGADTITWPSTAMGNLPVKGRWVRLEVPANKLSLESQNVTGMAFTLYDGRAAWGRVGTFVPGGQDVVWLDGGSLPTNVITADPEIWDDVPLADIQTPLDGAYGTQYVPGDAPADPPPPLAVSAIVDLKTKLEATPVRFEAQTSAPLEQNKSVHPSRIDQIGLEAYIKLLDEKIAQADDKIDFGFLRVHTDIYRIRQLVLSSESAIRLAVSPALADIAKGQSAAATKEEISSFYDRLKNRPVPAGGGGGAGGAGEGGSAGGGEEGGTAGSAFASGVDLFSSGTTSVASSTGFRPILTSAAVTPPISATPTLPLATLTGFQPLTTAAFPGIVTQPALSLPGIEGAVVQPYNPSSVVNVLEETPIVGAALIRTTSIASRFTEPAAPEATKYSATTQHDVVKSFVNMDIALDGLTIPQRQVDTNNQVATTMVNLADFRANPTTLGSFLNPVVPNATDESHYFSAGVDVLDNAVATLRVLEGRVQGYKQARSLAQEALNEVRRQATFANTTLGAIEDTLAEARHDVTVGRALLAEETARVNAINTRRLAIIRTHVHYLVYCRPRAVDALLDTPIRYLDPGLTALPVPSCLSHDVAVPEELRALVNLLRDVPVKWLPPVLPLIAKLDKVSVLQETIVGAQQKAQVKVLESKAALTQAFQPSDGLFGQSISKVYSAQSKVVSDTRAKLVQMDTKQLKVENWSNAVELVATTLSPGDLMDAKHGRIELAQQTAQHLDNIAKVAACLYAEFGAVLPAIRLGWAERLSQYDAPVILKNLANLPRWHEIEFTDRREMQQLVDWLFQQVDNQQREAYDIMNDLIRVCVLLASHAPVNQIIAGHVPKPVVVRPGHLVNLGGDIHKLAVGMHVLMYQGNTVAARGIVEDLGKQGIATRVTQTITETVQLEQNAQVHYVNAQNAPLTLLATSSKSVKMQMMR